jgi:membrane protein DedA with SNARE-associated domain
VRLEDDGAVGGRWSFLYPVAMEHIIGPIVDWVTAFIGQFGSWGWVAVFILMTLESACIPIPSEAIMPFAGFAVSEGTMSLWSIVAAGVAGNVVGSWIAYWIGLYGGRPFVDKYGKYVLMRHHHLDVAERWFDRWGAPTVFFSRMLPIVRTFISLPAGMARMPFWKFTLYTALGCIPWVFMLGYVGVKLGDNWEEIRAYLHYADYVVAVGLVALAVWWIVRIRRRRDGDDGGSVVGAGDEA